MTDISKKRITGLRILGVCAVCIAAFLALALMPKYAFAADMYRMYNPNSGEHFYTANANERDDLYVKGWDYEGIGWVAPDSGADVYRLYNPNAGDHHYTPNVAEREMLIGQGWNDEGVGWKTGGTIPLYRQYNPNAVTGSHNFTTSKQENNQLAAIGWTPEGIGWHGVGTGRADAIPASVEQRRQEALAVAQAAVQPSVPSSASEAASQGFEAAEPSSIYVYKTRTGKKFHRESCPTTAGKSVTMMLRSEAHGLGLSACEKCRP